MIVGSDVAVSDSGHDSSLLSIINTWCNVTGVLYTQILSYCVRGAPVCGSDLWEHRAISWLRPDLVHVRVRKIDNIVVNHNIFHCDITSLGI